jgi:hypothetical protein
MAKARKKLAIALAGLVVLYLIYRALARVPPPVAPADWFKRATEIALDEVPDYWEWGGFTDVVAEYDVDHDGDKEIYFWKTQAAWFRCARLAHAKLKARLTGGTFLRGSVSGFVSAPIKEVGTYWIPDCPTPDVLRFIIRDETIGEDYIVGSMGVGPSRPFKFEFDWVIDPTHEYSMRFEIWNYFYKYYYKAPDWWYKIIAGKLELWVEDITIETDAKLKL